jgi:hypothetical protein
VTPELLLGLQQFVTAVGGPMVITIAVLALMWKMLVLMGKQNEILTTLSGNVAADHELGQANSGKLDIILTKLERGVCRETDTEVDAGADSGADHRGDRRAGRGRSGDLQSTGSC